MRKGQYGTLELEIRIGTRTAIVTVSAHQGGWATGLEEHVDRQPRFDGEPTIVTIPASTAHADAQPAEAAIIRAIYRPT